MSIIRKHATLAVMVGIAAILFMIAAGASSLTAARSTTAAPVGAPASTCAESAADQSLSAKPCKTCSGKPYCTCTYNGQPRLSCEPCCYGTFNGGQICLD
ncbi:MAG TPA: hypothetical protein VE404_05525 [Verrucomicrobiae bacterium]|nr:hypothetical protein [Verrucomicrobiae bacterium]